MSKITKVKYKIIETVPERHQIVVRYYTDELPESAVLMPSGDRAYTDVSIAIDPDMTADQMHATIIAAIPTKQLDIRKKMAAAGFDQTMARYSQDVGKEFTVNIASAPSPISDAEIERLIAKVRA